MHVFIDVKPEDHDNFLAALEMAMESEAKKSKRTLTNAERCKRYRDNKKMSNNVAVMSEKIEEREEKEEILPPSSPSSLLSSPSDSPNIYPITPYNPPLSEEREEREENLYGGAAEKRGELKNFGPHVMLSEDEFLRLQKDYGYEETLRMIQRMNDYIGEDPKLIRKYQNRNHNLTLRNWKNRDTKSQPKAQTTQDYIDAMDWSGDE